MSLNNHLSEYNLDQISQDELERKIQLMKMQIKQYGGPGQMNQ